METSAALAVMSALSQPSRYRCLELLLAKEAMSAGDLAEALGIPPSLMSSHLSILTAAGLVTSSRSGRSMIYKAEKQQLLVLIGHLVALAGGKSTPNL